MGRSGTIKLGMELMKSFAAERAEKPRCCMAWAVVSCGQTVSKVPFTTRHWLPTPMVRSSADVRSASRNAAPCGRHTSTSVVAEESAKVLTVDS